MKDLFGHTPIPKHYNIRRPILAKMLHQVFCQSKMTGKRLVRMLYSEFEAVFDFLLLCKGARRGEKISLLFNPHRLEIPGIEKRSWVEAFNNHPTQADGLARACLSRLSTGQGKETRQLLYGIMAMNVNKAFYPFEFPPFIARRHFQSFQARSILDPCAGWGGRMIGAASVGAYYEAWEPSTKTYKGLVKLGEWLKGFETGFDFLVHHQPFEDGTVAREFDLAYASPPYFNTERYSDEPTDSANRYPTFDLWVERFYLPMIYKALERSKGGLVINIGCRRYDLRTPLNCFRVRQLPSLMTSKGGLGRRRTGGEAFFHIQSNT